MTSPLSSKKMMQLLKGELPAMKNSLFNNNEGVTISVIEKPLKDYLGSLKNKSTILDSTVDNLHLQTWEEVYPFMPLRLKMIEAVELFGSKLPDPLPEKAWGYPYRRVTTYFYLNEDNSTECLGDDFKYPVQKDIDWNDSRLSFTYDWQIYNPEGVVVADFFLQPTQPIKTIELKDFSCQTPTL